MDLLDVIWDKVRSGHDFQAYVDLKDMCHETLKTDQKRAVTYLCKLSDRIEEIMPGLSDDKIHEYYSLHRRVLLLAAPYDYDKFLLYVEWDREPDKKFYPPRRKKLRQVVDALQELADDKLDLLAISLPPGVGKTTLAIFYLCWLAGKNPDEPMLAGSHSNAFIRGVYDECLRIMNPDGEYLWSDVFPGVGVVNTNAKDCRIDLGTRKRFETLEFTSIGTGNAGLYRAVQLLYCDDLVASSEVAFSKERLDKLWQTYTTDLRQRKQGDHCKELHIATRWSVHDVIGRLEEEYGNGNRAKFITIPAMDENDESNFDYAYGVGYSTKTLREQREIMEDVDWKALFMNRPIEREGLVYDEDELRRYFELPKNEPDAIIAVCDTKDRGKDYLFMPVAYVYGQDYYIEDCVCNNGLPDVTDPLQVNMLLKHKVTSCRYESNSAGGRIAEKIQKELKDRGGVTHITTKYTNTNKETKILSFSGWVKEHCLFKDETCYKKNSEYGKMMDFLCSYTMSGKNKHDDVPDGMAMLADYAQSLGGNKVEIFQRPW